MHHLLSDIERGAFLIYDFLPGVTDIREQFPLNHDETQAIAERAGIRHPVGARARTPLVQTTDLVIDMVRDGRTVSLARSVKRSVELQELRALELEIERRYWTAKGVDWGIVTERELHAPLLRNLELLQGCNQLNELEHFQGYYAEHPVFIAAELEAWGNATLQEVCRRSMPGSALMSAAPYYSSAISLPQRSGLLT